ncbi:MAG: hypothetical protein A2722_02460 [Candidatus Doudnabacteria bacterium RIFCSPHIGHO2_01_FULL_50_11]|uniref:Uncharacterized protein n=1 Tax=Candidatus Doudnabacteria bacterium RIFCSPHIGHO2_01_FULL_50_11 TaxID=1817828 RepID=A0A1F5PGD1_9BACT|nr:MAG: hypothetical protein A2722_02460 [Candidatus Doudnabacteria bacterium RIFCSPHIGHO2_01_FULL_50_11]
MTFAIPRRALFILLLIAAVLLAAATLYILFQVPSAENGGQVNGAATASAPADMPQTAVLLAGKINELSPTPPTGDIGWVARRISFVEGPQKAYIEYTDTHLALRVLVEYTYQASGFEARVLATFEPDEFGGWTLAHGTDSASGLGVITWITHGSGVWQQEDNQ